MNEENLPELEWLAFLYVADELEPPRREAFEKQLSADQGAREAVAKAVDVTQNLAAAHELDRIFVRSAETAVTPAGARRAAWLYPLAWMGAGAAACILVAVAAWSLQPGPSAAARPTVADQQALELAVAWNTARHDYPRHEASWERELARLESQRAEAAFGSIRLDDDEDDLAGIDMPTWMHSAVATESESEPDEDTKEN
jgi:hypothetical protein